MILFINACVRPESRTERIANVLPDKTTMLWPDEENLAPLPA